MSDDCIFCMIVAGTIPCFRVYEDDRTLAFLDVNPLSGGHTVVIPKKHVERTTELDADGAAALFGTLHRLVKPVMDAVDAPACNIGINDGREAGQYVPHIHWHIIPRTANDGGGSLHTIIRPKMEVSEGDMKEIASKIAKTL